MPARLFQWALGDKQSNGYILCSIRGLIKPIHPPMELLRGLSQYYRRICGLPRNRYRIWCTCSTVPWSTNIHLIGYSHILPLMDEWDVSQYLIHPKSPWIIHAYSSQYDSDFCRLLLFVFGGLVSSEDMISFNGHISLHGRPGKPPVVVRSHVYSTSIYAVCEWILLCKYVSLFFLNVPWGIKINIYIY